MSVFSWTGNAQQVPLNIQVQENKVIAAISLPGGIEADFTLSFEKTVGLTAENIGLSAELIDVTDFSLLNRLPDANVGLNAAFPMMITVEPLSDKGFSFSGLATVDIHTHNLDYVPGTPLRFFKAPVGGEFKDITTTMGKGSYRARGTTGKFSQFIIAADLRSPVVVINGKLDDLSQRLSSASSSIDSQLLGSLNMLLGQVESAIAQKNYLGAAKAVGSFISVIEQADASQIPDVWRSSRDIDNIAGELLAYANTLRFSLRLAN